MLNLLHFKKSPFNHLLFASIASIASFNIQAATLLIADSRADHILDGKNFEDIRIEGDGTEALIQNSTINGSLLVLFGGKGSLDNDIIRCLDSNCKAIDVQGIGLDSSAMGDSSDLVGSRINIVSNGQGLSNTASALVNLDEVTIQSTGYGLNLNGSVSKNNIINTTNINNFHIISDQGGVSAIMGAQVSLSNGTILTSEDNAFGIYLGGANYKDFVAVQTKANIQNVTVHTTGKKAYGLFSQKLTGGNPQVGGISYWDNSRIITDGEESHGILAAYSGNDIYFNNGSSVQTFGDNAYGVFSIGKANVYLSDSQVNTQGNIAHGAVLQYSGNIELSNSSIRTQGIGADGLHLSMGSSVTNNVHTGSTISLQKSSIISEKGYGIATEGGELLVNLKNESLLQGNAGLMNVQDYTGTKNPMWNQGVTTVNLTVDGSSTIIGKVETADSAIANIALTNHSIWQFDKSSNLTNLTNDHSTIQFNSNSGSTSTLTVNGNYMGNGGLIMMNGKLAGDNSPTDKLIINGDTSGNTYVQVNNLGGLGDKTVNGIELIHVDGNSAGNFEQQGTIFAGAYDYSLVRGADATNVNNWYLTSTIVGPGPVPSPRALRPDAGSYLANLFAANTMFNLRLHDRQGETSYIDFATGERKTTSMWLRYQYSHNKFGVSDQFDVKNSWTVTQLGGDVGVWSSNDKDRFHLGFIAGYGRSTNDVENNLKNHHSSGKVDGYSLGLYGTWYQNDVTKTGGYIDSWVMWNDLKGHINGQNLNSEKYDIKGVNLSLESGYTLLAAASEHYNLWLQPQGQMTWMGVDADKHTESNGTKITGDGNNLQTRLGLRAVLDSNKSTPDFGGQIFVETNWLYNSEPFSIKMDGERVYQSGSRNLGEIKAGIESTLYKNANIWANVGYQKGDHRYRSVGLMFGAQVRF